MLDINFLLSRFAERLKNRVGELKSELQAVRGNLLTPEILEHVKVNCYDQIMILEQLCSISTRPPRELVLQAWDESIIPLLVKAIEVAQPGMQVARDGNLIRATLPQLTRERREEYMKMVRKAAEETRIGIRHFRDETIKELKAAEADKEITEDQFFKTKEKIQNMTDEANNNIESVVGKKIDELKE